MAEYLVNTKHILKYLIDNNILIPKKDDCLFVPAEIKFRTVGNVLFIEPQQPARSFVFDSELNPDERPIYDKSKLANAPVLEENKVEENLEW